MRAVVVGSRYTLMSYGGVYLGAGTGGSSIVRTDAERDGKEERLEWRGEDIK